MVSVANPRAQATELICPIVGPFRLYTLVVGYLESRIGQTAVAGPFPTVEHANASFAGACDPRPPGTSEKDS